MLTSKPPTPSGRGAANLSCAETQTRFIAYLKSALSDKERAAVEKHLAGCSQCSKALREIQNLDVQLITEAARYQPYASPEALQRIRGQTARTLRKGVIMERSRKWVFSIASLASLALIAVLVFAGSPALRQVFQAAETEQDPTGEPAGEVEPVGGAVITFGAYESQRSAFEPLIEEFNREHPDVRVQFAALPEEFEFGSEDYFRAVASAADTFLLYPFSAQPRSAYFRDLLPLIEADPNFDPEDFWPEMLTACQDSQGNTLGVPLYATLYGVFYAEPAFTTAGLPLPAPGWTMDNFWEAVQALSAGASDSAGYAFADSSPLALSILGPLVDGSLETSGGKVDAEDLSALLAPYLELAQQTSLYPLQTDMAGQAWQIALAGEKRPALWVGGLGDPLPGDPSAGGFSEAPAVQLAGFAPYPANGEERSSPVSTTCAGISAGARQPRAAWSWLNFLSRQVFQDDSLSNRLSRLPARQSAAENSGFWGDLPPQAAPSVRFSLEHAWYGSRYTQAMAAIEQALTQALAGEAELGAALAESQGEQASIPPAGTPEPIQVATPRPTERPGVSAVRFYPLTFQPQEQQALQALVDTFNQSHPETPVQLGDWNSFPPDGKIYTALSRQFDCYTWYNPDAISIQSEEAGEILSLNAFYEAESPEFTDDFYPGRIAAFRREGQLLGLPGASQPRVMLYNADLLAKRGLQPPAEDWTFEDFIALATAAANGAERQYGYLFIEADDYFFDGREAPWGDLELPGNPPKAEINAQVLENTLNWLVDLEQTGVIKIIDPTSLSASGEINRLLSEGRVGFWTANAGELSMYNMVESGAELPYHTGVVPLPQVPGGSIFNVAIERGFYISSHSQNPRACWEWIRFLTEQPGAYAVIPGRRSVAESPAWEAVVGPEEASIYRLALEQVPTERAYNPLILPIYVLRTEAFQAVLKGADTAQAIAEMQLKVDRYLACISKVEPSRLDDHSLGQEILACSQASE